MQVTHLFAGWDKDESCVCAREIKDESVIVALAHGITLTGRVRSEGDVARVLCICMHVTPPPPLLIVIHASPIHSAQLKTHEHRPCLVRKNFQGSPSYRIFGRVHGALNIDKNKN